MLHYHVGMQPITVRLTEYDYERADACAKRAGLSVAAHIRSVYKRELDGIDAASVIREELERELMTLRAENAQLQEQVIEIVVALRDSIRNSQTELLDGFREAIAGKTSGQSGLLQKLHGRPSTST